MKQQLAYLIVAGQKVLALQRATKYGVALKLRTSGPDGVYLEDESKHLEENKGLIDELMAGKVIKL